MEWYAHMRNVASAGPRFVCVTVGLRFARLFRMWPRAFFSLVVPWFGIFTLGFSPCRFDKWSLAKRLAQRSCNLYQSCRSHVAIGKRVWFRPQR